eukprot:TRINITY_DN3143_c5_g4_i1.p1 TRINITY_DN3143_c5_g4~~TRINITY_DN3143_c5_g4_i1.p1  ORF type:complete len:131 (-),score=44.47 TRINITY_DN3143_c5_g4_i1:31-423(-)
MVQSKDLFNSNKEKKPISKVKQSKQKKLSKKGGAREAGKRKIVKKTKSEINRQFDKAITEHIEQELISQVSRKRFSIYKVDPNHVVNQTDKTTKKYKKSKAKVQNEPEEKQRVEEEEVVYNNDEPVWMDD